MNIEKMKEGADIVKKGIFMMLDDNDMTYNGKEYYIFVNHSPVVIKKKEKSVLVFGFTFMEKEHEKATEEVYLPIMDFLKKDPVVNITELKAKGIEAIKKMEKNKQYMKLEEKN